MRRWSLIGAGFVAAVLAVLVLVITNDGPEPSSVPGTTNGNGAEIAGVEETAVLLEDIPQQGFTIGDPKAPVTLLEFVDLQCPFCRAHQLDTTPALIKELVRTGEAQISLVPLAFLGPDSVRARNVLLRLARQNRAWEFANLFYWNQGEENTGYVTDEYLAKLVEQVPGAKPTDASANADPEDAEIAVGAERLGQAVLTAHKAGTPGFTVGPTGAPLTSYRWIPTYQEARTADQLVDAVRKVAKSLPKRQTGAGTA